MHYSVFRSAGIEVHRHPELELIIVKGGIVGVRAGIAQEVPRRAHKSIHGICLALAGPSTTRTGGIDKLLVVFQWRFAGRLELGVFGQ